MIETECKSYESNEAQLNDAETNLKTNGERLKQLIDSLRQEISAVKDIDTLKNTQDEFVFDLSKFQTTQQIEYQKVASSLEILHQTAQQSARNASLITQEEELNTITILTKFEMALNERVLEIQNIDRFKMAEKQRELSKMRRQVMRDLRDREMLQAA